ncbi:MAG: hypothetical protein NTW33_02090 [Methanoregula sp.]|nr:hypothetical protein [Methanoregula sp.]
MIVSYETLPQHGRDHFPQRDAFEIDFFPEIFNFREAQIKEIVFAIQPGLLGNRPLNQVLRGLPGTGKTTAVRRIFFRDNRKYQATHPGVCELPG